MQLANDVEFHEASIEDIRQDGDSICLLLDNVTVGEDIRTATVSLRGIHKIVCDGSLGNTILKETDDGEVVSLDRDNSGLICLVVNWTEYQPHRSWIKAYEVESRDVEVEITGELGRKFVAW